MALVYIKVGFGSNRFGWALKFHFLEIIDDHTSKIIASTGYIFIESGTQIIELNRINPPSWIKESSKIQLELIVQVPNDFVVYAVPTNDDAVTNLLLGIFFVVEEICKVVLVVF